MLQHCQTTRGNLKSVFSFSSTLTTDSARSLCCPMFVLHTNKKTTQAMNPNFTFKESENYFSLLISSKVATNQIDQSKTMQLVSKDTVDIRSSLLTLDTNCKYHRRCFTSHINEKKSISI